MEINKILVPLATPGVNDLAFEYALKIARKTGASLTLLHVLEDGEDQSLAQDSGLSAGAQQAANSPAARPMEEMRLLAEKRSAEGIEINSEVVSGSPGNQILGRAKEHNVDLVVMMSFRGSAVTRVLFGSTADEVSRKSHAPVILLRDTETGEDSPLDSDTPDGLIVPLDGQAESEHVVPVAIDLAKRFKAKLIYMHSYSRDTSEIEERDHASAQVEPVSNPDVADMETYLDRFVQQAAHEGVRARAEIRRAMPIPVIVEELSATVTNPLTVVDSSSKSGLLRVLMGSVPDDLNRKTSTPVMVVPRQA